MGMEGDAADLLARQCIQIAEATAKLAGSGAKNLVAFLYAMAKHPHKLQGKTKMQTFLKNCNGAAKVFPIEQKDLVKFRKLARQYGILWAPIKEKKSGTMDVIARAEDASAINRIREIAEDLEHGRETALCTDPYSFYRKHRALAAISRAYYYNISDRDILYGTNPHKKYSFSIFYTRWVSRALKRCLSTTTHDTQELYPSFLASFAKSGHLHLWNKEILPPEYEPEFLGPVGFVFEDNPLSETAVRAGTNLMRQLVQENIAYQRELARRNECRRAVLASRRG